MTVQSAPEVELYQYLTYEELTAALKKLAAAYPKLAKLESIGQSHEGRELWVMTITNFETGADSDKPAYWIDSNIHAAEVTGSAVSLYTIHYLLTNYGHDAEARQDPHIAMVNRLLDTRTFYIMPRHTPDGAERVLTSPYRLRSSTRAYPTDEDRDGLHPEDLDGDGVIRQMRIPDPNGDWKVSERDHRVMVKRRIDEEGGKYYRLYTEGLLRNYDGYTIKVPPVKEGLDLNRNYGFDWAPENEQAGAGPFPLSEPETHAVSAFWTSHHNICGSQSYHTWSGVILRPYSGKPDEAFATHDLQVYQALGERGTELTGYPMASIFHGFRYDPKSHLHGAFLDWAYDHQGVFAISTELWDVIKLAGIEKRDFIEFQSRKRDPEDEYKIYQWLWQNIPEAFKEWHQIDHPQLGTVEVGGWNYAFSWQNPPAGSQWLKDICRNNAIFSFSCAIVSPLLTIPTLDLERVSEAEARPHEAIYRVTAVVENSGFLPTYVSKKAQERKFLKPVTVELIVDEGIELLSGEPKHELGQLEGRSNKQHINFVQTGYSSDYRAKAEWFIRANPGAVVTVEAFSERGGRCRRERAL